MNHGSSAADPHSPQRAPLTAPTDEWRRLSARVVWVDLAQSVIAILPTLLAVAFFGADLSSGLLWPLIGLGAWGVVGAIIDVVRWLFTRYRVTDADVERRTGVFVRRHRSIRRERIRSVDTSATLRHRIAGLRVVAIGAGQQASAGESALLLDALQKTDAERLRRELLHGRPPSVRTANANPTASAEASAPAHATVLATSPEGESEGEAEVLATFRSSWVLYNMFSIWGYLMAAGLVWGVFWLASTFGLDLWGWASRLADWEAIGWAGTVVAALVAGGVIGVVGMAVSFLTGYWRFELARVQTANGSFLRTRRGLFTTREVNRDEARTRGLTLSEPLLWRWIGMTDTNIITTGLGIWDMNQPTAILPRGPGGIARQVARDVLGDPSPIEAPLTRHPVPALRRRLWWATAVTVGLVGLLAVPVATAVVPLWVLWVALGTWPVGLAAAVIAYRALGHAIVGDYLVVRSGLMSRHTSALRRDAISTIAVRQSILQRRLGLSTVSAMTAAGWSAYEAPDVASDHAVRLAARAAPGVIVEFGEPPAATVA